MIVNLVLALMTQVTGPPVDGPVGTIEGVVVNGTSDRAVGKGTVVVLRVEVNGQFVAVTETTTDDRGTFCFEDVPAIVEAVYLPGANCGEVHFPGPRVQLTPELPHARVQLKIFEPSTAPNPLVIRRHEVTVEPVPGALRVTESLRVENPSRNCFVGVSVPERDAATGTLRLEIPPDFERTTFHSEFFGRRFSWHDNALVTSIPWPPGTRDVDFTYLISNDDGQRIWERRVDLPCDAIRLTVYSEEPADISCDTLSREVLDANRVTFASNRTLPAGQVIRLRLDNLPVPLTASLRWIAVGILLGAVVFACVWVVYRGAQLRRIPPA